MKEKIYLSVVVPCYNEAGNLRRGVLSELHRFLSEKKFPWEVIISEDGSTDESRGLIKAQIKNWKNFRLIENPHAGKPAAIWHGINAARGKYILFTDMDQSTPINQLDKLLQHLENGVKVIIGSRGRARKKFPLYRRLGSVVFMSIRKLFVLPEINDTQCGFKLFDKKFVKRVFSRLEFIRRKGRAKGWKVTSYDVELLHLIKRMGEVIREVDVVWEEKDESVSKGSSLRRYIRESWEMLIQITRVKLNDLRGYYNSKYTTEV